jgi:uncharacterized integral membrane protein
MRALIYFVFILLAAVAAVVFTALNPGDVTVNLYFRQVTLPFSLVVVASMFFGVLLGMLAGGVVALGRRRALRRLRKQLALDEKELSNLRKLPLRDD